MAANTMDAIKKKMQAMKIEKDGAMEKAKVLEERVGEQKQINEKQEEEIQNLHKTISSMEGELDEAQTQLAEATTKLENTEKQLGNAENEVGGLTRRTRLLEEDYEQTVSRLTVATENWKKLQSQRKRVKETAKPWKVAVLLMTRG
jgi:tropomyosin-1